MSNTIYWDPSVDADIDHYDIQRSATQTGTFADVASVTHVVPGPNYANGRFFYVHAAGAPTDWYRLRAVDAAAQASAWSDPFQAQVTEPAIARVQVQGRVLLPDGLTPPTSGRIEARLSQPGSVLDGTRTQRVAMVVAGDLGADGSLPSTFKLTPNDILTPGGTYYVVRVSAVTPEGLRETWSEKWQLASAPDPIDIGAVPRLGVVPGLAIALGYVNLQSALPRYTTATRPSAASFLGKLVRVKDPGAAEEVQLSLETSSGGFEWVTIALASS